MTERNEFFKTTINGSSIYENIITLQTTKIVPAYEEEEYSSIVSALEDKQRQLKDIEKNRKTLLGFSLGAVATGVALAGYGIKEKNPMLITLGVTSVNIAFAGFRGMNQNLRTLTDLTNTEIQAIKKHIDFKPSEE